MDNIYEWKPTDRKIIIDTSKIPLGGLAIILPKLPIMKDVTPAQEIKTQRLVEDVRKCLIFKENRREFEKKLESCKINGEYHTCIEKKPKNLNPHEH